VAKRTNGEVQAEVFWGTLGGEQTLLNGVSLGTLDGYHGAYTGMREFDSSTPWACSATTSTPRASSTDRCATSCRRPSRPSTRCRCSASAAPGAFAIQTKPKPASWADLKGLKIRGGAIEGVIESIKAVGANPVTMAFNEVYSALQQGVVDGQVTLGTLVVTMKYYEVVKHWIKSDFGLGFDKVVLSQRAWSRIKPAHQKMMQDLFFEMEEKKWYQVLKQSSEGSTRSGRRSPVPERSFP
jgi:TRAP-type C4-dicarboxylate transport system substrate-binding protein